MNKLFLLSPAFCGGRRAGYLLRPNSELALARQLAAGTLTLGAAFAFMSGLYFRGKLAYAKHFATCPTGLTGPTGPQSGVLVITPTRGLLDPDTIVSASLLKEFAKVDVDTGDRRYRKPLDRDLGRVRASLAPDARVVLLGSIATGKYVDALISAFGDRLHFPPDFVGRGDMSRGGLMLRSVNDNIELEYASLLSGVARHGARPPKLLPLPPGTTKHIGR
jgi:hypothetical protein